MLSGNISPLLEPTSIFDDVKLLSERSLRLSIGLLSFLINGPPIGTVLLWSIWSMGSVLTLISVSGDEDTLSYAEYGDGDEWKLAAEYEVVWILLAANEDTLQLVL